MRSARVRRRDESDKTTDWETRRKENRRFDLGGTRYHVHFSPVDKRLYSNRHTENQSKFQPPRKELYKVLNEADKKSEYVFERNGNVINADILTMDFSDVMTFLGFKHTLHQLRHTFSTRCHEKGIDPKVVQAWMGHCSMEMTLNTYTHATTDLLKKEIQKLLFLLLRYPLQ